MTHVRRFLILNSYLLLWPPTHVAVLRYCLVHLKPDADVDRVIEQLSKISFGTGKITVERKTKNVEPKPVVSRPSPDINIYYLSVQFSGSLLVNKCFLFC